MSLNFLFISPPAVLVHSMKLTQSHSYRRTVHLQMEKHDGYERPLWSFVDDVCVGESVVERKGKKKKKVNNQSQL